MLHPTQTSSVSPLNTQPKVGFFVYGILYYVAKRESFTGDLVILGDAGSSASCRTLKRLPQRWPGLATPTCFPP